MTPLLTIHNLEKKYGRRRVLRDVSFTVSSGEAVGLIGPNGAGKTTLLRIVVGLQAADAGVVHLGSAEIRDALRHVRVGYFAGEPTVPASVRSRNWRSLFHDVGRCCENRPVRDLSRGTRQLLGLRTVFGLPALRLIVLDEPWEGLDPDAARWLSEAIRARRHAGAAVLVSSHRLHDLAGTCERFAFLDHGRVSVLTARDVRESGGAVTGDSLLGAFDLVRGGR